MNKGFILKALFLLCFLFSQTAQGQSFTPGEIWPDNHQVHINAHGGEMCIRDRVTPSVTDNFLPSLAVSSRIAVPDKAPSPELLSGAITVISPVVSDVYWAVTVQPTGAVHTLSLIHILFQTVRSA